MIKKEKYIFYYIKWHTYCKVKVKSSDMLSCFDTHVNWLNVWGREIGCVLVSLQKRKRRRN